jgi:hypothetical protein
MRTVHIAAVLPLLVATGCAPAPSSTVVGGPPKAGADQSDGAERDAPGSDRLELEESIAAMPAVAFALSVVAWSDEAASAHGGRDVQAVASFDPMVAATLAKLREGLEPSELSAQFARLVARDYGMARALADGFERHALWSLSASLAGVRERWTTQLDDARRRLVQTHPRAGQLLLGVSPYGLQGLDTLTANQVVIVGDDRPVSLYAVPNAPIRALWPVSEDEILIVSGGKTRPGAGAIVPPRLHGDLIVARLRLSNLTVDEAIVRVDEAHALHVDLSGAELRVVSRDHRGEGTQVARCRLDGTICDRFEPVSGAPPIAGVEITAHTSYDPPNAPPTPTPPGLVRRQTQVSRDGRRTAFVTQCTTEHTTRSYAAHRALSVVAAGSDARIVEEGWGWLHARWLDDRHLAFELDPRIRDAHRSIHEELTRDYVELNTEAGYEDWKPTPHGADRHAIELVTMHLRGGAPARPGTSLWNVVEQRVGILDVETGAIEILPWPHLRIRSSFTIPPLGADDGHYLEVAPAGADPHAFADRDRWRCAGPPDRPLGECKGGRTRATAGAQ